MVRDEAQNRNGRALSAGQGVPGVMRTTDSLCWKAVASSPISSTLSPFPQARGSQDLQHTLPRNSEKRSSGPSEETSVVRFS